MTTNVKKRSKPVPKSGRPYKRRSEAEMLQTVKEIHENGLPKKTACRKYGLNRNTLKLFILKQSTKQLHENDSLDLLSSMNENQQHLNIIPASKTSVIGYSQLFRDTILPFLIFGKNVFNQFNKNLVDKFMFICFRWDGTNCLLSKNFIPVVGDQIIDPISEKLGNNYTY